MNALKWTMRKVRKLNTDHMVACTAVYPTCITHLVQNAKAGPQPDYIECYSATELVYALLGKTLKLFIHSLLPCFLPGNYPV